VGTGNCYFKGGTTYTTNTAGSNTYVGGIRVIAGASTTTSASASPTRVGTGTPSGVPATCPTDNLKNVTDSLGVSYQVRCQTDINPVGGGGTAAGTATNTFNDCFILCDTTPLNNGNQCTGFTYVGNPNGAGSGTCYLKGGVTYTTSTPNDNNILAGIRLADAGAASGSSALVTTTTTTSSSALATTTTTTISTTTTTTTSSSSSAASTALNTYGCPANDNSIVTDAGTQYQLKCGFQAQPATGAGTYQTTTGQSSLNVCLRACTTNAIEDRNNPGTFPICAGFTFVVTNTGDGSGNCAYRLQTPLQFGSPSAAFIGLIKVQHYQPAAVTTTTTSTTTTSSVQTLTLTMVSYATVTTTTSYAITTTAISTAVQTVTTSYPVTQTQVSTAPGKYRIVLPWRAALRYSKHNFLTIFQARR
jgi:hypothetical protein